MAAPHPNLRGLDQLVRDCLQQAECKRPDEAAAFLRVNARRLEQRLGRLAAWAAAGGDGERPAPLQGLTAFDLSDAAETLRAHAARCAGA